MSPKDCAYIVERLAIRFMALVADHETKMVEHRAAFGARTEADAKIIVGLREEVKRLQWENATMHKDAEDGYAEAIKVLGDPIALSKERDALRAEVAALQERLRASIARGDFAQMEVAALKSQTPKHPVKVGEWVKASNGAVAQVLEVHKDWYLIARGHGWTFDNCEPCDPPIVKREPTIGDTVRLVTHPERAKVAEHLQLALQWPWIDRWGVVGQTGKVVKPLVAVAGAVAVALDGSTIFARWPIDCLEVVAEATHDTEAGKAAAESALKTEPVAEEIKVGDVVEVVSHTGRNTWLADVGSVGTVVTVEEINDSISVHLEHVPGKKNALAGYVSFCDVRKVTT
jgi:hypothetical protein